MLSLLRCRRIAAVASSRASAALASVTDAHPRAAAAFSTATPNRSNKKNTSPTDRDSAVEEENHEIFEFFKKADEKEQQQQKPEQNTAGVRRAENPTPAGVDTDAAPEKASTVRASVVEEDTKGSAAEFDGVTQPTDNAAAPTFAAEPFRKTQAADLLSYVRDLSQRPDAESLDSGGEEDDVGEIDSDAYLEITRETQKEEEDPEHVRFVKEMTMRVIEMLPIPGDKTFVHPVLQEKPVDPEILAKKFKNMKSYEPIPFEVRPYLKKKFQSPEDEKRGVIRNNAGKFVARIPMHNIDWSNFRSWKHGCPPHAPLDLFKKRDVTVNKLEYYGGSYEADMEDFPEVNAEGRKILKEIGLDKQLPAINLVLNANKTLTTEKRREMKRRILEAVGALPPTPIPNKHLPPKTARLPFYWHNHHHTERIVRPFYGGWEN